MRTMENEEGKGEEGWKVGEEKTDENDGEWGREREEGDREEKGGREREEKSDEKWKLGRKSVIGTTDEKGGKGGERAWEGIVENGGNEWKKLTGK